MIYNVVICNDVSDGDKSVACYSHSHQRITLGCNVKALNEDIRTGNVRPYYDKYKSVEELYEDDVETLLVHEVLHCVLHRVYGDEASTMFDKIDKNREITGLKTR